MVSQALNFSLTQLEYLCAVDRYQHFGKAAQSCHVSQPTLSAQIQKVEDHLNTIIFDRSKQPVLATPEGHRIIEQAKIILRESQKLAQINIEEQSEPSGHFHLGIIPSLSPYLLPLFITHYSKRFPKVLLKISEMQTHDIVSALKSDELDGGLLATPLKDQQLIERHLFYEPFYLFAHAEHNLLKAPLSELQKINSPDLWTMQEGHCIRHQILEFCHLKRKNKAYPNLEFQAGSLDTIIQLIRNGEGFTLLPELALDRLSQKEKSTLIRAIPKPTPCREISLVIHRSQYKLKIVQSLGETIQNKIPSQVPQRQTKDLSVLGIE
jgi:LysR family hydrogen peroxide-inducible transcriptional activator